MPADTAAMMPVTINIFDVDNEPVWGALNEATFRISDVENRLAITEIMYNPLGGNNYEFIELKNVGEAEIAVGNMHFDEGVVFAFPPGYPPLAPGEFMVLVRDPASFAERYPNVSARYAKSCHVPTGLLSIQVPSVYEWHSNRTGCFQ